MPAGNSDNIDIGTMGQCYAKFQNLELKIGCSTELALAVYCFLGTFAVAIWKSEGNTNNTHTFLNFKIPINANRTTKKSNHLVWEDRFRLLQMLQFFTFQHCAFSNASSNCWPEKMYSYIGCISLTVLHCAFSNESSKSLHDRMQSHIGCICLTFLQCVFSNESLNWMHEQIHGHIGCICLTFLHCAFLNVSSNGLSEKMHSYIDCICLTFLQCVFSNETSKHLHKRTHSHTACTCLTFPHCTTTVCFQMCP